jgi:spermidine synthase
MKRSFSLLFLSAVFLSGFCSLVYQLTWDRLARNNFGGDNVSATIVVTTFMLGLGLGAYLFRKPSERPLRAYGLVEIGIGLFAIISPYVIANISLVIGRLFPATESGLQGVRLGTIAGCAAFLLVPCVLMGATLPMMFAAFFGRDAPRRGVVGFVYGLNILGAMTGTLAVPAVLLNHFPIDRVLQGTGALSILAGLIALRLQPSSSTADPAAAATGNGEDEVRRPVGALLVAFLTGAVTIVYEVILIRHSVVTLPSSVYSISFVLFTVLLSLGAGSLVLPRLLGGSGKATYWRAGGLLLLAGAGLLGSLLASRDILLHAPKRLPDLEKLRTTAAYFVLLAAPLFVPMGAVFPMLCAAGSTSGGSLSRETGKLYLANALGAVAGAVLFHSVLSVQYGTKGTVIALAGALGAASVLAMMLSNRKWMVIPAAALAAVLVVQARKIDVAPFVIGPTFTAFPHISLAEGSSGIATVDWYDAVGNGAVVVINGQGMGAIPNEPHDMRILAGLLTAARPRRILILGVATGSYIPPLLGRPDTESLTLVDWSHEIGQVMKTDHLFVVGKHMDVHLKDPRVHFILADARVAVAMFPAHSFDLVIDTLARPTWPGATGLKTPSYFKQIARILTDDGFLAFGTFYKGWRHGAWDEKAWHKETLAGLYEAFADVHENADAGVILASPSRIPPRTTERIDQVVTDLAYPTRLEPAKLREILTTGFNDTPRTLIAGARPFNERSVQAEYYYSFADILRFIRK